MRPLCPICLRPFLPDYIVGSVHFVNNMGFDYSPEQYDRTAAAVGGVDALYQAYFDLQHEMIRLLRPAVVGHFDLVRLFDPGYRERLEKPFIAQRVRRNLELIQDLGLIMDFNLRSLAKGAEEPYISSSILKLVREYGIAVVPGDDSHGISSVGNYIAEAIGILQRQGFSTEWQQTGKVVNPGTAGHRSPANSPGRAVSATRLVASVCLCPGR